MIKSFSVSNFKRIEKNATIDFSKVKNYEFESGCIKDGLINTAVLLGKNGSGKTSLVTAMFDIVYNLTDNFVNLNNYSNYLNLSADSNTAVFRYVFLFDGTDVVYTYRKTNISAFVAEKLEIGGKTVLEYDRERGDTKLYLDIPGTENLEKNLEKIQISAVKYVKSNTVVGDSEQFKLFLSLFSFVEKMLLFWSLETRSFTGFSARPNRNIVEEIVSRNHFKDLQDFFNEAGIEQELVHKNIGGAEQLFFKFPHDRLLEFTSACSTGMSSLLLLYYWLEDINDKTKSPCFVCIDEFDAFYHFELSRFILNKLKGADCQVLLTTQNTTLLGNDVLRPDCYFLFENGRISNLPNRTDKELRFVHNIEKLYRGGTFGL